MAKVYLLFFYLVAKRPTCHRQLLVQLDHLKLGHLHPGTEQDMEVDSVLGT